MNDKTNPSIRCSVNSCSHHKDQHCKSDVCTCESTECASFQLGDHGGKCGCN